MTPEQVIELATEAWPYTRAELVSSRRWEPLSTDRTLLIVALAATGSDQATIADLLNRDQSSVSRSLDRGADLVLAMRRMEEPILRDDLDALLETYAQNRKDSTP